MGYESVLKTDKKYTYGAGGEFMLLRTSETFTGGGGFGFNSLYGFGRYKIDERLYGTGRLGYNFYMADSAFKYCGDDCSTELDGGLFYGIGIGIILTPKINLEGLYIHNEGTMRRDLINGSSYSFESNYARMHFCFAYTF